MAEEGKIAYIIPQIKIRPLYFWNYQIIGLYQARS